MKTTRPPSLKVTRHSPPKTPAMTASHPSPKPRRAMRHATLTTAASVEGGKVPVTFEIMAPQASSVFLAGSFNGWKPAVMALGYSTGGRWTTKLFLPPGRHEYLFVVDGQWVGDPADGRSVPNPFGGLNSVVEVSVHD